VKGANVRLVPANLVKEIFEKQNEEQEREEQERKAREEELRLEEERRAALRAAFGKNEKKDKADLVPDAELEVRRCARCVRASRVLCTDACS
jgi:hypothetical protein